MEEETQLGLVYYQGLRLLIRTRWWNRCCQNQLMIIESIDGNFKTKGLVYSHCQMMEPLLLEPINDNQKQEVYC